MHTNKPRTWDIALVGSSAPHAFILFAVGEGLCRTRSDFESHFVDANGAWQLAEELSRVGFIETTEGRMRLTEQGIALVRSIHLPVSNAAAVHDTTRTPIRQVATINDRHGFDTSGPPRKSNESMDDGSLVGAGVGAACRAAALGGEPDPLMGYHLVLYHVAILPEHFQLKARRVEKQGEYELELWLMNGSHMLRFEHGNFCCCELVTDQDRNLPASGVIATCHCAGEHEIEHTFDGQHVNYINSVQTETLSESLFLDAVEEYEELARENNALVHSWMDDAGRCLSVLDVQHSKREVHIQAYHLLASGGLCVRSQTIFEIIR